MRARGFTLIELMVSITTALLLLAVTVAVFVRLQVQFSSSDLGREAQEGSRDAMLEIEPALRRLGFGIDPRYALDFRDYSCATVPCRDSISGPDQIVFVARNPYYQWSDLGTNGCALVGGCFTGNAWPIVLATATAVTVTANAGDVFLKGRVIEGVCTGGSLMTMATVATTATAISAGPLIISLVPAVAGNPYEENNFTSSCFASPGGAIFLVDRYRYEIMDFSGTPYLMLDQGLDLNQNGTTPDQGDLDDLIPVAKGVEDMQIAYLLNVGTAYGYAAPDSNTDWIVGNQSGTVEEPNPSATAPTYDTPTNDPSRYNMNPANVQGLRLTISVRSLQPDLSQTTNWLGDPLNLAENRNNQLVNLGQYRRYVTSTSANLRNMAARSASIF